MPWHTNNIMDQRTEFALKALTTENFRALCKEYAISPKTGYKWKQRLLEHGLAGLQEESRRPESSPKALGEEEVCRIVRIKQAHPTWGARKIREIYMRGYGEAASESSFKRVLERAGMVEKRRARKVKEGGRLATGRVAKEPNEVWTIDFKGWWYDPEGRCNPLTVRDEYSRYVLDVRHLADGKGRTVQACLERLFELHGLPQCIRSDNGSPFASATAVLGLSRLSAWWLALGIDLERSRPGCPQDNGGHERMHLDIARELQSCNSLAGRTRQAGFDVWRRTFNEERPHEALGMKCPAEVYSQSPRSFTGAPQQLVYEGMDSRRVNSVGLMRYEGGIYMISTTLGGWDVGLKPLENSSVEVYFCRLLLGHIRPQTASFIPANKVKRNQKVEVAN
jgi:transposase InsO family protein